MLYRFGFGLFPILLYRLACALLAWLRLVSILLFFVAVRLSEQAGGAVVEAVGSFSAPLLLYLLSLLSISLCFIELCLIGRLVLGKRD